MPKCTFCDEFVPLGTNPCPGCGAPIKPPTPMDLESKLQSRLDQGEKLAAVRLYKEQTGSSLLQAKNAVDAMEAGQNLPMPNVAVDTEFERELLQLLGQGQKIEAVKLYRENMGGELAEAKRAVESLAAKHGMMGAQRIGCSAPVLVGLFLAVVIAVAVFLLAR